MAEDHYQHLPELAIVDEVGTDACAGFESFTGRALAAVASSPAGPEGSLLAALEELVLVMVEDSRMADLHARFSGVPGPTDVLTFQHGEIVVSVDTACTYAAEHGISSREEIGRYIVHGLLHLHGYDDTTSDGHADMHRLQELLLTEIGAP